jgi:hypothetical protein
MSNFYFQEMLRLQVVKVMGLSSLCVFLLILFRFVTFFPLNIFFSFLSLFIYIYLLLCRFLHLVQVPPKTHRRYTQLTQNYRTVNCRH